MSRTGPVLLRGGVDVTGRRRDVLLADGEVAALGESLPDPDGATVLDAAGLVVAPGLVDLQVNGAAGIDITAEPERLWEVGAALVRHGVTAFVPTVITADAASRDRALRSLREGRPAGVPTGGVPLGLHFEGPMLAASYKGAHPERWLRPPSLDLVAGWSAAAGVRIVTLAPELPGAVEVIRALVDRGVVVWMGHTGAGQVEVLAAIDAGATGVTHLFNAMAPLHHREAGPVGVALGGDRLVAGVIADGHHVTPLVLAAALRALGAERFLSVSDATAALGMPDGVVRLGDQEVVIADGTVRLRDGTLAGSAASLADCLDMLLLATGCPLATVVQTATQTPARVIGDPRRGRLVVGARADVVLLEHDADAPSLRVAATLVGGELVHDARHHVTGAH